MAASVPVITMPGVSSWTYRQGVTAVPMRITATAADGGTLTYQWYVNGEKYLLGTSDTCTPKTDTVGIFSWQCEVTNTYNGGKSTAISKAFTVTVEAGQSEASAAVPKITTLTPLSNTYQQSTVAMAMMIQAEVSDGGMLSYQWYVDGVASSRGNGNSCIPATDSAGTFQWHCVVTNTKNGATASATSETFTITVQGSGSSGGAGEGTGGDSGSSGGGNSGGSTGGTTGGGSVKPTDIFDVNALRMGWIAGRKAAMARRKGEV